MNDPVTATTDLISELDAASRRHVHAFIALAPNPAKKPSPTQHDAIAINARSPEPERLKTLRKAIAGGMMPVGLIMLDPIAGRFAVKARIYAECGMGKKQAIKFLDQVATYLAEQANPYGRAVTPAIGEADKAGFIYPVDIRIEAADGVARSFTLALDGTCTRRVGLDSDSPRPRLPFRIAVSDSSQPARWPSRPGTKA